MSRLIRVLLLSVIALAVIGGCVPPDGQTSGSGGTAKPTAKTSSGDPILLVNGESVYAGDLIASPLMRQALRQYIYFDNLRKIAEREGVTADQAKVDEHLALLNQRLVERGETLEKYLSEMAMTEEEYRSNIVDSLLQDAIIEKRTDVTPEKMQKIWDEQRDKVVGEYLMTNHLPASETENVSFEDCHDILFSKVMRIEGVPVLGNLQAEMKLEATLDITCIKDPALAERLRFLILESDQQKTRDELPEGGKYTMPGAAQSADTADSDETEPAAEAAAPATDAAAGADSTSETGN